MVNERITESELVLPSLYLMHIKGTPVKTSELIKLLEQLLHPEGNTKQAKRYIFFPEGAKSKKS